MRELSTRNHATAIQRLMSSIQCMICMCIQRSRKGARCFRVLLPRSGAAAQTVYPDRMCGTCARCVVCRGALLIHSTCCQLPRGDSCRKARFRWCRGDADGDHDCARARPTLSSQRPTHLILCIRLDWLHLPLTCARRRKEEKKTPVMSLSVDRDQQRATPNCACEFPRRYVVFSIRVTI